MAKKKRSTRRLLFFLLGGFVVVIILGLVASQFAQNGNDGVAVEISEVEVRTVTQVVTASGRVQPEIEIVISPDVSGEIIELPVIEGQQVKQGQLLARIKPDFYVAQVEQAEASLSQGRAFHAQRRADLLGAEQELARQQSLYDRKVVSESVYQQAEIAHKISKAAVEAAEHSITNSEALLREAREQLSKTVLYAPMAGSVSKLNVELGERVVGTTQMAGTDMMTVARLDQMEVEVEVNENDVVNVALNDSAAIEIDAYPERIFKGLVTEIANSARLQGGFSQEQVTNFPVKIRITDAHNVDARLNAELAAEIQHHAAVHDVHNLDAGLDAGVDAGLAEEAPISTDDPSFRPGMSGTVDIFTHTEKDVVVVPIQAVTVRDFNRVKKIGSDSTGVSDNSLLRDEDLRKIVFIVDEESKAQMVEVETGIADSRFMQIHSTLVGGEKVIIGPYSEVSRTLRPGRIVREERGVRASITGSVDS